jgi:hypothetical protein
MIFRAMLKRRARHAISFTVNCDVVDPASRRSFAVTISSCPEDRFFAGILKATAHSAAGRRFLSGFDRKQLLTFVLGSNFYHARVASKGKSSGGIWLHAIDVSRQIFRPVIVRGGKKIAPERRRAPRPKSTRGNSWLTRLKNSRVATTRR